MTKPISIHDTSLNEIEESLKKEYFSSAKALFSSPKDFCEAEDYLHAVSKKYHCAFPDMLFHSDFLEEERFFSSELDTAFFRHLRYLPPIWHSHTFLEVTYVASGTCTNYIMEQTLTMSTGDICIIAPNTLHAIRALSDDCVIYNILLRTSTFETAFFGTLSGNDILSDFFTRILYHTPSHPYLLFRTGTDMELFAYIGFFCQEFYSNRQYKNRMLNNLLTAFFIILLRKHTKAKNAASGPYAFKFGYICLNHCRDIRLFRHKQLQAHF